ncbi:MAG: 50S ribosomal protein L24 [Planctomycetota bacterium]|jgi:large subunit ribosomal protein L24
MAVKTRIRKGDTVQVIAGAYGGKRVIEDGGNEKERGQRGKVLSIDRERGRAIVEGINMVTKHQKTSQDPAAPQQGRVKQEASIHLSNLMLVDPDSDKATRVRIRETEKDDAQGRTRKTRVRVSAISNSDIPERA